jgi:hypothetical protein
MRTAASRSARLASTTLPNKRSGNDGRRNKPQAYDVVQVGIDR